MSNSSSSSFILGDAKTVKEGLIEIYSFLLNYDDDCHDNESLKNIKHYLDNTKNIDKSVCIPWTCNYETVIHKVDDGIRVDTCNNIRWLDYLNIKNFCEEWDDEHLDYKDAEINFSNYIIKDDIITLGKRRVKFFK